MGTMLKGGDIDTTSKCTTYMKALKYETIQCLSGVSDEVVEQLVVVEAEQGDMTVFFLRFIVFEVPGE